VEVTQTVLPILERSGATRAGLLARWFWAGYADEATSTFSWSSVAIPAFISRTLPSQFKTSKTIQPAVPRYLPVLRDAIRQFQL